MMRWICSVVVMMLALPAHAAGSEQEATLAVHGGVLHGTLSLPDGQGKVPVALLPLRSVGPEPAMISTTGTGVFDWGSNSEPNSSPLPVSRLMGRCSTTGEAAKPRLENRVRVKSRTRSIIAPS